jgi:hypothetical protein
VPGELECPEALDWHDCQAGDGMCFYEAGFSAGCPIGESCDVAAPPSASLAITSAEDRTAWSYGAVDGFNFGAGLAGCEAPR